MVGIEWGQWARAFPFVLQVKRCEDCGSVMEEEYVHDKHSQEHWRGVEAWVCQNEDCEHAEHKTPS